MKNIVSFVVAFALTANAMAQKNWKALFDQEYSALCTSTGTIRESYLIKSISGDSFDFMSISNILDALQCMYLSTGEDSYRNDLIKIINNILSTAQISKNIPGNIYADKNNYLGLTSKNRFN